MLIRWIRVSVEGSGHPDMVAYALFRIRFASSGQPPHAAARRRVNNTLAGGCVMLKRTSVLYPSCGLVGHVQEPRLWKHSRRVSWPDTKTITCVSRH